MEQEENKSQNHPEVTPEVVSFDYFQGDLERALKRKELYDHFPEEINRSQAATSWLDQFEPESVKQFIQKYADQRAEWMTENMNFKEWNENDSIEYVSEAFDRLVEIQQKKLFDLQCLWRAEKMELRDVEICFDFRYWELRVMNCPFLDPVSPEDIDLYQQYLRSGNFEEEQPFMSHWQDYQDIKEAYEESDDMERNFPAWYDFYNGLRGSAVYMSLPDLRGEKEEVYLRLSHDDYVRNKESEPPVVQPVKDNRPFLSTYGEGERYLVRTFEDVLTKKYYKAYKKQMGEREGEDWEKFPYEIDWLGIELQKVREKIPVRSNSDYRFSLLEARNHYKWNKIADAMPAAYDQYLLHKEGGLKFKEDTSVERLEFTNGWRSSILKGRKLAGEPETLNF